MSIIRKFKDHLGNTLELPHTITRVISVVPSLTELIFHLDLDDEVVAVTKFCLHPKAKVKNKPKIGGTKKLDLDGIYQLDPQLIIANKEENEKGQIAQLSSQMPVWVSDISTLAESLAMIREIGDLLNRSVAAEKLSVEIEARFKAITIPDQPQKALYLIWRKPYMTVGTDTFIHRMMTYAGYANVIADTRYPQLSVEQIEAYDPQVILLSSEPFPFKERHILEIQEICPEATVKLVDGEMFSWYGSRLLKAPEYFRSLGALQ